MTNTRILLAGAIVLSLMAALPLEAQDSPGAAFAKNLDFVGGRAVDLVDAIPAEDLGWQPMEGVRSVSQAAMHMAGANYFFAGQLGLATPEGIDPRAMGEITDKGEVIAALGASLEHLSKAFQGVEDTTAAMEIFGQPGTVEDMMLVAIGHVHEHFGQLIAYARSNEVTPPWSAGEG